MRQMILPHNMNKLLISALLSSIVHCSCTHYYYVANVQNIPMLQEKKDLYVSGFMGVGDGSQSIELQTAYAAGEKIGVMADFMTAWRGKVSNNDYKRGTYFDGAIGYFKPLSETLVFEIYGGAGISSQRHEYEPDDYWTGVVSQYEGSSELSSVKFFIQPSLGFKMQPLFKLTKPGFPFEFALSARTCRLSYTRLINNSTFEDLDHINEKKHYFIEPALTMRMGGENIKMQFQFSFSAYLGNPSLYFYEEVHLSGGVVFNIPPKKNINTDSNPK